MFLSKNLPEVIPIFPLSGALLLPRANLPLQIFEPKYLQMLEDCLKSPDRLVGMIQFNYKEKGTEKLHSVGCAGRVQQFSETPDGRYMITLIGISRFKIIEEPPKNNYFILIDNKQKPLLETVSSRCLIQKFFLPKSERSHIIKSLISLYNIESIIDYNNSDISPGLFLKRIYGSIMN